MAALLGTPASAAEARASSDPSDAGWLRLSPAKAKLDVPIEALTESKCPDGTNFLVSVSGPGIPAPGEKGNREGNRIGNIVGNTEITALPETPTGQLYVPLSYTLDAWFRLNAAYQRPLGIYELRLVCVDVLDPTPLGTFAAKVVVDRSGHYEALGEAAKSFNTEPVADDPSTGAGSLPNPAPSARWWPGR